MFTGGADTASWMTAGRVIDTLRRTPVAVGTVGAALPAVAASPRDAADLRAPSWLAVALGGLEVRRRQDGLEGRVHECGRLLFLEQARETLGVERVLVLDEEIEVERAAGT